MHFAPMGYVDGRNFHDIRKHSEMLEKVEKEIRDSKEKCIVHLKDKYGAVPVWAMVEVVSFGGIARTYRNMHDHDKSSVARRYAFHPDILSSYIQHISVVRNLCAHHARLWDRAFHGMRPPRNWPNVQWSTIDTRRLFFTLLLVHRMTRHIPKACFDRDTWKRDLIALLKDFQTLPHCNAHKIMGIPSNGFDDAWWV